MNIIIEGVDRLGKGTLIDGLKQVMGATLHVHYEKPQLLEVYKQQARFELSGTEEPAPEADVKRRALELYQRDSFKQMFDLLNNVGNVVLDRAHLGEIVYAPRYRGYSGDYVLEMEKNFGQISLVKDMLVLLTASDMSFLKDDGLSFDFDAKEAEQDEFVTAFYRSSYCNKLKIDVVLQTPDRKSLGRYAPASAIQQAVIHFAGLETGQPWEAAFIQGDDGVLRIESDLIHQ